VNLIAFGGLLDLIEELEFFQSSLTSGVSRVFLQGVLANTVGFVFLTFGLYRWVPSFLASTTVLHNMVAQLAGKVESQADQIRKNEELLRLQSLNRTILESVPLGLVATGEDNLVLHVNRAAERLVGQDEASMVGLPLGEAFRQPTLAGALEEYLTRDAADSMSTLLEDLDLPAGPTTLRVTAARSEPGPHILVLEDVTQNVKAERAEKKYQNLLIRNERLATLAGLISGVAHELNNPLSIIVGYTDLLSRSSSPTDPAVDKPVRAMERAATRCLKIVKGLLNFAHQTQGERHPVRVNELLSEAVELIAYQLRVRDIDLETDIHLVPLSLADGHQLLQVFFNLLNNAYQALENSAGPRKLHVRCSEQGGLILDYQNFLPIIFHELASKIVLILLIKIWLSYGFLIKSLATLAKFKPRMR
jgi:signal transduction histidine kinase